MLCYVHTPPAAAEQTGPVPFTAECWATNYNVQKKGVNAWTCYLKHPEICV